MSSDRRYALIGHTHASSGVAWGSITGTLSSQTDLQAALDAKAASSHVHEGTTIDATGVTDGYVLTADGAGNAAWEVIPSGVTDHGALTGLSDDDHSAVYPGIADTESITGAWTFSGLNKFYVSGTQANLNLNDSDATTDEQNWIIRANSGVMSILTAADATPTTSANTFMQFQRTATAATDIRALTNFYVRGGNPLRIYDSGNTDYGAWTHDGTDFLLSLTTTANYYISGHTQGVKIGSGIYLAEQSAADADIAGFGQVWISSDTPCTPWYTDDAGNDYPLGFAAYRTFANQTDTVDQYYVNGAWYSDNATAYTLTLEASSSTAFPVGAQFTIWNEGSGTLTINEGTGDTLWLLDGSAVTDTAGGCTMAQGGYATVIRKSAATWLIMGAGLTA